MPAETAMAGETVTPATMTGVERKALMSLVTEVAMAIKVAMIPAVAPAFPATAIERAIGRIA
jgi:hypothetical protein